MNIQHRKLLSSGAHAQLGAPAQSGVSVTGANRSISQLPQYLARPRSGNLAAKCALLDNLTGANMRSHSRRIAALALTLSLLCACGRPPADTSSNSGAAQKLPFDQQPRPIGISPSQSLIPSTTKLPEGTPIAIRLQSALSSASSHAGDTFSATIDEPVVVDGQTLIPRGTPVTGRVLEAKPAASSPGSGREGSLGGSLGSTLGSSPRNSLEPGYLRLVLVSLRVDGKTVLLETSSIFAKGGAREERNSATRAVPGAVPNDIALSKDRRLSFRLAQTLDLQ